MLKVTQGALISGVANHKFPIASTSTALAEFEITVGHQPFSNHFQGFGHFTRKN